MGGVLTSLARKREPGNERTSLGKRKRNRGPHGCELFCKRRREEEEEEPLYQHPLQKRPCSTSAYIYKRLFEQGHASDVSLIAMGRTWHLHRFYLSQAGYFSSMFSGSWKESDMQEIQMDVPDPTVDADALDLAFGSLYQDECALSLPCVVSCLAAASLIQADGLLGQCVDLMLSSVTAETVCRYHTAAMRYGQEEIVMKCHEWLQRNLLVEWNVQLLKELDAQLLAAVVASADLVVIQVEMDIYTLLKRWLFLQLQPDHVWSDVGDLELDTEEWLKKEKHNLSPGCSLLSSSRVSPHLATPFQGLRRWALANDGSQLSSLLADRILPPHNIWEICNEQWLCLLNLERERRIRNVTWDNFAPWSVRCGRKINHNFLHRWRWTGFHFGLDILLTFSSQAITLHRNLQPYAPFPLVSMAPSFPIAFRLRVFITDQAGGLKLLKGTGVQIIELEREKEEVVLILDDCHLTFPLYISCNFLFVEPPQHSRDNWWDKSKDGEKDTA
uniref:germ cell-less protein-like 2 n=1 Tax=Myxine glutinosa TaxID=7769 RepID=UPI00358F7530